MNRQLRQFINEHPRQAPERSARWTHRPVGAGNCGLLSIAGNDPERGAPPFRRERERRECCELASRAVMIAIRLIRQKHNDFIRARVPLKTRASPADV